MCDGCLFPVLWWRIAGLPGFVSHGRVPQVYISNLHLVMQLLTLDNNKFKLFEVHVESEKKGNFI